MNRRSLILDAPAFTRVVPVRGWGTFGAVVLAAQAALLMRWIASPYFHHVGSGATPVPFWMKLTLVGWQVALPVAGCTVVYLFVVRPWRRDRRLTVDGLLVCAFATLWVQDPMSAYGGEWFTYNAWLVNMGSWVHNVPGWMTNGTPEHQIAYPLLIVPGAYICIFLLVSRLGCWVMRSVKNRYPAMGRVPLVASCFVAMALFDVVFEGIIFMPLGAWEYPGGHWAIFANTYHKYPLNEALTTGLIFTAFAAIRYFVDDRGQTVAERGSEAIAGRDRTQWTVRVLAVTGLVQLAMFCGYTAPNFVFGLHSTSWNQDTQSRSYLTYTCGPSVGIACPRTAGRP